MATQAFKSIPLFFFILSIKKAVLIEAREGRALKGLFSSYFILSYLGC
jgi:hypothetical protein